MKWYQKWFWKEPDKIYHDSLHTIIPLVSSLGFNRSILFSIAFSEIWGFAWEIKDMIVRKEKFDWMDILANQSGLFKGVALLIIIGWLNNMFGG